MNEDKTCDYIDHYTQRELRSCYWRDTIVPKLEELNAALLEALEGFVVYTYSDLAEDPAIWREFLEAARAAIAKARGEQS